MANNLLLRTLSAAVLAPIVIYILYLGGIYFQILATICLSLMLYEWFDINRKDKRILFFVGIPVVIASIIEKANSIDITFYSIKYVVYVLLLTLIYGILAINNCTRLIKVLSVSLLSLVTYLVIHMLIVPKPYGAPVEELCYFCGSIIAAVVSGHLLQKTERKDTLFISGLIYMTIPMLYVMYKVTEEAEHFFKIAIWILMVVWSCDIFAYFGGRLLGGAKLAPQISPKKTWSGAIVGAVATLLIVYYGINQFIKIDTFYMLTITAVMIVASILGDLLESKAKRMLNVKDSGNIIPGHGGVLDRLDSLIMVLYVFVISEMLWYLKLDLKMLLTSAKWV